MAGKINIIFCFKSTALLLLLLSIQCSLNVERLKVESTNPNQGQTGVARNQIIQIEFNRRISESKCIAAFGIQPPINGLVAVQAKKFVFTPSALLTPGLYVMSLSQTCEDLAGRDLEAALYLYFVVGTDITPPDINLVQAKINQSGCQSGDPLATIADFASSSYVTSDICANTALRIQFSESMNRSSVEANLTTVPNINSSFSWSGGDSELTIQPFVSLQNGGTYVVTVGSESKDRAENRLARDISFSFTVGSDFLSPQVCLGSVIEGTLCAAIGGLNVPPQGIVGSNCSAASGSIIDAKTSCRTTPIAIQFSKNMEKGATNSGLSISPPAAISLTWSDNSNDGLEDRLTIQPMEALRNGSYTVTVTGKDLAGNIQITPFAFSFTLPQGGDTTPPSLAPGNELLADLAACAALGATYIADFQSAVCNVKTGLVFRFNFSEAMELAVTAAALQFSPNINGNISWTGNTLVFTPTEDLLRGSQYRVLVNQSAKDVAGNFLAAEFVRYFSTAGDSTPPALQSGSEIQTDIATCDNSPDTSIANYQINVCNRLGQVRFFANFNEAMDQATTPSALSFAPSINGTTSWSGNTLIFTPLEDLKNNTQYKVTISTLARDVSRNNMREEFSRIFTTQGDSLKPTVTNVYSDIRTVACDGNASDSILAGNSSEVCTDSGSMGSGAKIKIVFSEAMDATATIAAFSINPTVSNSLVMPAGNELVMTANSVLVPNTQYKVTIADSARDANSNPLAQTYNLYFNTTNFNGFPTVSSIAVRTGVTVFPNCDNISQNVLAATVSNACEASGGLPNTIVITFSEAMNRAVTNTAIALSPSMDSSFSWSAGDTVLTIQPNQKLIWGKRYTTTVSAAAKDAQGHTLQNSVAGEFLVGQVDITGPSRAGIAVALEQQDGEGCVAVANDLSVGHGSTSGQNVCVNMPVVIAFPERMKTTDTQSAISLSPTISPIYSWNANQDTLTISFSGSLQGNSQYNLAISASAKDLAGNAMDAEFLVSFKTENTAPQVRAIGLQSQAACNTTLATGGGAFPRTHTNANCWWDLSESWQSADNYRYRGGNGDCGLSNDSTTDNIRIIFSKDMEPFKTANAVAIKRLSLPSSIVQVVDWFWDSLTNPRILTLRIAENTATGCPAGAGSASAFDGNEYDMATTLGSGAGFPIYVVDVNTTATDSQGVALSKTFSFAFEGD